MFFTNRREHHLNLTPNGISLMFHNTTSLIPPDKLNSSSHPTETKHTLASPIVEQVTSWKMSDHHPGLASEVDDYLIQITDGTLTYEPMGFANLPLRDTHLRQQVKNDVTPPFTVLIVYEISIKTVGRAFPLGIDLLRYKVVRCPKLGHPKGLLRSSGRQEGGDLNLVGINKLISRQCGNCSNNIDCDQSMEDGMKRRLCRCRNSVVLFCKVRQERLRTTFSSDCGMPRNWKSFSGGRCELQQTNYVCNQSASWQRRR